MEIIHMDIPKNYQPYIKTNKNQTRALPEGFAKYQPRTFIKSHSQR